MKEWTPRMVEMTCWEMQLNEFSRSQDRAKIDELADGFPPYRDTQRTVNFNDLSLTRLAQEARAQLYNTFNSSDILFTATTDAGAVSKRSDRSHKVTKFINRKIKRNYRYYECNRSKFSSCVMHGIGVSMWQKPNRWLPIPLAIGDVLIPSRTYITFENLPFFAIQRSYTANELRRLTSNSQYNPGFKLDVAEAAIQWVDEQAVKLWGSYGSWNEYWNPEKQVERFKETSGVYGTDVVPTIDCWDFYALTTVKGHTGWRRMIVFDAEGGYGGWSGTVDMPSKNLIGKEGMALYDSGDRVVADDIHEILHFQFGDLSATAPQRYHSARGLGFILYSACHLQNRLRCAFAEAIFENLMMYYRVNSSDDAQRALKIELRNRGVIDETVHFLTQAERWNPNFAGTMEGMNEIKQIISENSASYVRDTNYSRDKVEKTGFQVQAEMQAMQVMISAALQQAYHYQTQEYQEIVRRFMLKNSDDPDVVEFRGYCDKHDIPEKFLVAQAWEVQPERIPGGGNKTLQMSIAQQLMQNRAAFPPESQNKILKLWTLAMTDDSAIADDLAPSTPTVSHSASLAMMSFGSLMSGALVKFPSDMNLIEITQVLIGELALQLKQVLTTTGMTTPERLAGFQNVLTHISNLVGIISQDAAQKELAKKLAQESGQLANEIKGLAQRLAQKQKADAAKNGNGGLDGETRAKVAATLLTAKVKAANTRESHAQRTAQRQAQFEMQQQQDERRHAQDLRFKSQEAQLDIAKDAASAALDIKRKRKMTPDAGG